MPLLDEAASLPALRAALETATKRRGGPGPDGVTVAAFSAVAATELPRLRDELLSGTYVPLPARRVLIPKPGGGHRALAVGCVRDRVVQHALAKALSARLDSRLHEFAFAYRPGRSARSALATVDEAIAVGRLWVVRGDIEQFFDRIDPNRLLTVLRDVTEEEELVALVRTFLEAGILSGGEISDPTTGTPQGSPLSPFLANLYLCSFDTAIADAGLRMVRYADDLCINVVSREEAQRALELVRTELSRLALSLNDKKVEIRHVGEGFAFLGFHFSLDGRNPGAKAARRLAAQVEQILETRPLDGGDEIDELLRGWLGYYGSLAGVDLPRTVRERAAQLESKRAESALSVESTVDSPTADTGGGVESTSQGESAWARAAFRLAAAGRSGEISTVSEGVRTELGISTELWPALAAALGRFDGAEAAELLASAGRFADANDAARITAQVKPEVESPASIPRVDDSVERPRLDPRDRESMVALLDRFGGNESVFVRQVKREGQLRRESVEESADLGHVAEHFAGSYWMGVVPLRANNSARFVAVRVIQSAKARKVDGESASIPALVVNHTKAVRSAFCHFGLEPIVCLEPGRGYVIWGLFSDAIPAARARAILRMVCDRAGGAPAGVSRELHPARTEFVRDKPGAGVLWPLGLDLRTNERAWFCEESLQPLPEQTVYLRNLPLSDPACVPRPLESAAPGSPFGDLQRAEAVYKGCNVLRYYVDRAVSGDGATRTDRYFIADVLGRLGDEADPAVDAVFRHLHDYRPGLAARYLQRLYPNPTSCARIREKLPDLTASVGCDCKFRLPPRAYPTPALHAVGAAEIPALAARVSEAARRGGEARAARNAAVAAGAEAAARAAALCARLADLRRQARAVERSIVAAEEKLDQIMDEAGGAPVETPAGTLRRVYENGSRRFVLDL